MTQYLLDVNALVALGFKDHQLFEQVVSWVETLRPDSDEFATCAITELGFIRVLARVARYGFSVAEAKVALLRLKSSGNVGFTFFADDHDVSRLTAWVKMPQQTTNGHLAQLAKAHGATLTTLDRRIPGAFLIPKA